MHKPYKPVQRRAYLTTAMQTATAAFIADGRRNKLASANGTSILRLASTSKSADQAAPVSRAPD